MTRRVEKHRSKRVGAGVALAAVLALPGAGPATAAPNPGAWRTDPIWDDGNAEFCAYEIDWSRYGRTYSGTALLIAVKEPWAPDLDVKADRARPDGFDVLKLNHLRDVPTGIYTYHQMASAFIRRDDGRLQKLSVTSSEGCGVSTAHMVDGRLNTRSYFDGQGERTVEYRDSALPADALALALRDYLEGPPPPPTLPVFPSLMTGRFPDLEPVVYRVRREYRTGAGAASGSEVKRVMIELTRASSWKRFTFSSESPHPLIRYRDSEGTEYRLAKCERIPYWQMNGPGGEKWLPEAFR